MYSIQVLLMYLSMVVVHDSVAVNSAGLAFY